MLKIGPGVVDMFEIMKSLVIHGEILLREHWGDQKYSLPKV